MMEKEIIPRTTVACYDVRDCAFKTQYGRCSILKEVYDDSLCPFCKPKEDYQLPK